MEQSTVEQIEMIMIGNSFLGTAAENFEIASVTAHRGRFKIPIDEKQGDLLQIRLFEESWLIKGASYAPPT